MPPTRDVAAHDLRAIEARLRSRHPQDPARVTLRELPVCEWLIGLLADGARRTVAVNGPQGVGKSSLCADAVDALGAVGVRAVTVSIDDFYLPHDAQRALARAHPGDPYLEHRGYPGTHDIPLGCKVIDALAADRGEGVRVPRYDKSAHQGRGDRAPASSWPIERGPFALILVEGWMIGFAPVAPDRLADPAMATVNALLRDYGAWSARCDALVHLTMRDPSSVIRWRVDAERARRARGAEGLSDAEAEDYVRRFTPAYETWTPSIEGPRLTLSLGEDRLPSP